MMIGASWRRALCGAALVLLPGLAAADPIAGSMSQVGAWRVTGYTRGKSNVFDHCSLYRVQNEGFAFAMSYMPQGGIWLLGAEAPEWTLPPNEFHTGTIQVGGASYTFTGRPANPHAMDFNVAPELLGELKSGSRLVVTVNRTRHEIGLDGIEAATQRVRDCARQYAAAMPPVQSPAPSPGSQSPPPGAPPASLVAAVQTLLARLGYDPGPINGEVGLKTNMAISAFQKSVGERGDGLPSEAVRGRLEMAVAERTAAVTAAATPQARAKAVASTGTGFYISPDTIVTNFHVVNGCAELRLHKNGGDRGVVRVLATSRADDLAALRTEAPAKSFLKLRAGLPIKAAEPVLVFGYPLADALSSAGNTTLGNVTALAGMRDDSRYIQISAAVQPGNSGGPAVDEAGRLIGVVVSKLNALAIARITGDIPQNVNFAIKVSTLTAFLDANAIGYTPAEATARELPVTQRAESAEASSIQIECWK
jgi:S1-C subfamily serine protease